MSLRGLRHRRALCFIRSIRGGKLRVSLHLFNDETDIERLLTALDDVRRHS